MKISDSTFTEKTYITTVDRMEKSMYGPFLNEDVIMDYDSYGVTQSCYNTSMPDNWYCISNTTKCYLSPKVNISK